MLLFFKLFTFGISELYDIVSTSLIQMSGSDNVRPTEVLHIQTGKIQDIEIAALFNNTISALFIPLLIQMP